MDRPRSTATLLAALCLLALVPALALPAAAGPLVPDIAAADLPEAGTCAPIPTADVTWVTVGATTLEQPSAYRIDADPTDLDERGLAATLAARARAAAEARRPHDVWILARRDRPWGTVVKVLLASQDVGLFRVGLQVRAESGEGLLGFPLFLPAPTAAVPVGPTLTARRLDVRLEIPGEERLTPIKASHPSRLYAAAEAAVRRFSPVVAEVSIPVNTPIQDAVRAIDLLYRAGCAAVRLPYRLMVRAPAGAPVVELWVENRLLADDPVTAAIPPIRARKTPWGDEGAAQPGSQGLVLEEVPTGDAAPVPVAERVPPLPNYAARGERVPPEVYAQSDRTVRTWGRTLGMWLGRVLQPGKVDLPETVLVKRKRQGMGAQEFFTEARQAFSAPERVDVGSLRVQAYLFRGTDIVGQVDLTLQVSGARVGVVYGSWVTSTYPKDITLPPRETDPYAGGVPGHLRIWLEGTLDAARSGGAGSIPLAEAPEVLATLPPVAHPGVRAALDQRLPTLQNLVGWLRATPYDRIAILAAEGTAAVHRGGRVEGILRFDLEPEQGEISLASLKPRVAPR